MCSNSVLTLKPIARSPYLLWQLCTFGCHIVNIAPERMQKGGKAVEIKGPNRWSHVKHAMSNCVTKRNERGSNIFQQDACVIYF